MPTAGDHALASATDSDGGARHPGWILVATIAASSLAFIDGSVVNVALPSIGRSLGASPSDLQWTINAYLLPLSALLLLGGAAGDRFGRRSLLIVGTTLFAFSSVLCALAPRSGLLLAGRGFQGIGAALLMPNSLAVLGDAFAGEARGRAIGTWASIGAIASAVGPPLGGWLVGSIGWRAIFLLNLPVAALAIIATSCFVRESGERDRPIDWLGALLATLALGLVTLSLTTLSEQRELTALPMLTGTAGAVLLVILVLHERRAGERAMMPVRMFASTPSSA
ncbi:MFS transporter [Sphingobium amiense]|uniref:MFS transporter n=1 Tax=Sphingobium amiense TaxID=135719 RepID=UPI001F3BDC6F|nr:MFS transporter [Sphingobium amiense]